VKQCHVVSWFIWQIISFIALGQAEQLVQVLEAQRGGEVESLWLLRWLVLRSQLQPKAEEIYRTAANSGSRGAWQVLVYMLVSEGRAQEAREILEEADSIGDADAWWGLATLVTDTPEQFEELLRAAVSKRRPGAWMELANLLVVTDRSSDAIILLTEAVNEGQSGAAEELIETLEELGREDEARTLKMKGMKAWMAERANSL
jgi:tetratricopeptide (TPR) repeat protein